MRVINGVKTIVLNPQGQVLLLRRSLTDMRRPGEWDLPGGGVDDVEDFALAACRELMEEAGIEVPARHMHLAYAATDWYEDTSVSANRFLFVTQLANDVIVRLSKEHDEFKWVDVETAVNEFTHEVYVRGIRYAQAHHLFVL